MPTMAAPLYGFLPQDGLTSPVSSFATLNQIYFALATTSVLAAATLPFLRASVLSYGKLDSTPSASSTKSTKKNPSTSSGSWVKTIKSLQVPKFWFSHFYVYATFWMLYCTFDLWVYSSSAVVFPPTSISYSTKTTVIRSIPAVLTSTRHYWSLLTLLNYLGIMPAHIPLLASAHHSATTTNEPFIVRAWTPPPHVLLTMVCYLFQVIRRWYESWFVERPSVAAKIHVTHYIVGITFYSAMAPSTWIDAYETWIKQGAATGPVGSNTAASAVPPQDSMLFGLNGQCLLGLMLFIWASWHQYNCHIILANLRPKLMKKEDKPKSQDYKIPFGDWFQYMVAPHYSAEMLIYLSLYLMASSSPLTANSSTAPTLFCAWGWVVVNLGIVARETDQWYRTRFGDRYAAIGSSVGAAKASRSGRGPRRYVLIPFVY
ncbi:MAG: hypothetical protein JOS17DRAFT_36050 [Linnemannia elongata]|nr:MAG: hypothetical protein JOS17DRAFT_36050 [Linnemannia elongata]